MSLPAQPWPYAFWPAWLLTGRSRLVPPLATIRRLHLMLDAHASFRQRSSDMSCQSPERCHFQDLVRPSSGTFPGVKGYIPYQDEQKKRGTPSTRSQGSGWSSTTAIRKPYNRRLARRSKKIGKGRIIDSGKCSSGSYP